MRRIPLSGLLAAVLCAPGAAQIASVGGNGTSIWAGLIAKTVDGWTDPAVPSLDRFSQLELQSAEGAGPLGLLVASLEPKEDGSRVTPSDFKAKTLPERRALLAKALVRASATAHARARDIIDDSEAGRLGAGSSVFELRRAAAMLAECGVFLDDGNRAAKRAVETVLARQAAEASRRSSQASDQAKSKLAPAPRPAIELEPARVVARAPLVESRATREIRRRHDALLAGAGESRDPVLFSSVARGAVYDLHAEMVRDGLTRLKALPLRPWVQGRLENYRGDLNLLMMRLKDQAKRYRFEGPFLPTEGLDQADREVRGHIQSIWLRAQAKAEAQFRSAAEAAHELKAHKDDASGAAASSFLALIDFYESQLRVAKMAPDAGEVQRVRVTLNDPTGPALGIPSVGQTLEKWTAASQSSGRMKTKAFAMIAVGALALAAGSTIAYWLALVGLGFLAAGVRRFFIAVRFGRVGRRLQALAAR